MGQTDSPPELLYAEERQFFSEADNNFGKRALETAAKFAFQVIKSRRPQTRD